MVMNMLRLFSQFLKEVFKLYLTFGKRLFDIIFSILLIVILFPLFIAISILIKIFDTGPLIFYQKRIGLNENLFIIYKFRSMPINTADIPSNKISKLNLNWVNRFIRRTNLDELPQLFNILRGDMSFVGPRPAILSQKSLIEYRKNNNVFLFRPGVTGLAQILSFDGMSDYKKAKYDKDYVSSISFKNDILIILKTCIYLLKPPPIY